MEEVPNKSNHLKSILKLLNAFFCCQSEKNAKKAYDPYFFNENSDTYKVFCGLFHAKQLAIVLCVLKTILLFAIVARKISISNSELTTIAGVFIFVASSISYVLVIAGIQTKRYTLIIPYFTACVLVILILVMQLFMDFLDTANNKNTLEVRSLGRNLAMFFLIVFEVYTLAVVWKAFIYINDFQMHAELYHREKRQRLNSIFIKKCDDGLAYHPFRNHLITIREQDEDEEVPVFNVKRHLSLA